MPLIIPDTLAIFGSFFTSRESPQDRFQRAQATILAPDGLLIQTQKNMGGGDKYTDFGAVIDATQHDGIVGQQAFGLFNPTRKLEASEWAFAEYARLDILGRLRDILTRFMAAFPEMTQRELTCIFLPADPANRAMMLNNKGLGAIGGIPGYMMVQLWPSAGNMARFEAAVARVFAHQVRRTALLETADGWQDTLADWLILEGLAAAYVEKIVGKSGGEVRFLPFAAPPDWPAELTRIAQTYYGLNSYDDMVLNTYGNMQPVGPERPPTPIPIPADELAYSLEVMRAALHENRSNFIAAYLYGDEIGAAQGLPAIGLPPYAGFDVGYHLVQDYLQRTGHPIETALVTPITPFVKNI